jgi:hypothetical protein
MKYIKKFFSSYWKYNDLYCIIKQREYHETKKCKEIIINR